MSMNNEEIGSFIKSCYGLDQFDLEDIQLNKSNLSAEIFVKLPLEKAMCTKCEGSFTEVHDWQKQQAQVPPFGNYLDVTVHVKKPRGHCSNCLKVQSSKIFFSTQSSHPWLVDLRNIVQG